MNRQGRDVARTRGWRGRAAAVAAGVLALGAVGPAVLAGETGEAEPTGPATVADAMVERVRDLAEDAGMDADTVLSQVITTELPDGEGGVAELTAPLRDVLEGLGGRTTLDEGDEGDGGDGGAEPDAAGAPHLNAGGTLHLAANLSIETFSLVPEADLPPAPDVSPYDVVESDYVPSTPLVPGVNPLFLAAGLAGVSLPDEVTEAVAGLDDPILLLHPGGRLTSVQGSDWNVLGAHGAGSYGLGHNVDTGARGADSEEPADGEEPAGDEEPADGEEPAGDETPAGDPWPLWLPLLTGATAVPDTAVDFAGFAIVVNTSSCSLVRGSSNPSSLLYPRIIARVCVGVGAIIGDGVAFFDGTGPIDLRADVLPLWEPAPEELAPAMAALDDAVAQVDELTGTVLELVDVDLDGLTDPDGSGGGEAPSSPDPDGPDTDPAEPPSGSLVDQVLGLLP
jgi:hypothetical protein